MAFEYRTDSQQQIPEMEPPKERVGKFNITILFSFGILVIVWLAWSPVSNAAYTALARHNAKDAKEAIGQEDWARAFESISLARKRAPEDIEVIRTVVEFHKATNYDPSGLAQQLRLLSKRQKLTAEEDLLLGRSLIACGKTEEARGLYEMLPLSGSTEKPALDLLSSILMAEGHSKEAAAISGRATVNADDSPDAQFKAALEDLKSHYVEIRLHGHRCLWQLADQNTVIGLDAIKQLATEPSTTFAEAQRLLELCERHPQETLPARLQIISALMRLNPDQRKNLVKQEMLRFKERREGSLEEIAIWLMREDCNELVFQLISQDRAVKSPKLYPILMQCLAQEERWEELKKLLTISQPPVSKSLLNIALAEVQSHLQPDMAETRQLLIGTIDAAILEANSTTLQIVASLAEKLNLHDIAFRAYNEAGLRSSLTTQTSVTIQCLQKGREMALLSKNTEGLLKTSRKLRELSPSSAAFSDQYIYLRLILGAEMETVDFTKLGRTENLNTAMAVTLNRIPSHLLHALAAYRLGDHMAMQKSLAGIADVSALPAGQRAVIAGLLSLSGKPDLAYQIAEKVPNSLLLTEELTFLRKAL